MSTSGGMQLNPTTFMLRTMTLVTLVIRTWPLRVGLVPEQPMIVLFEPIDAVPCASRPLTKITAGLLPAAAVLNAASVVTSVCGPAPPPVVPPLSDAHPTGVGAPAMNDGTEHGVAACSVSDSSGDSESAQPPLMTNAQIIHFVDIIGVLQLEHVVVDTV